MINVDTGDEIEGQFEATGVSETVGYEIAETHALNHQNPVIQFLHGNSDTLNFQARLFQSDTFDGTPLEQLETLKEWTRKDESVRRPPIIVFWIGDGTIYQECLLTGLSGIQYGRPTSLGGIRDVTMTVNLVQFVPFDTKGEPPPETRFHKAKEGQYHELIAAREYGRPLFGDIIRKRNPRQQVVQQGDTVPLPSIEAIRSEPIAPTSIAMKTTTTKKDTPQNALRRKVLDRLNRSQFSAVVPEGL